LRNRGILTLTMKNAGFREIEHTADWQLEVWAADLAGLVEQAARGMYTLAGIKIAPKGHIHRQLHLERADAESLLVAFLSELLYLAEQERLGFDRFNLQVQGFALQADLFGAPIIRQNKEIKAVTYHNLFIQPGVAGLQVNVVFDV
jgi:SHS2 domain-containing protein